MKADLSRNTFRPERHFRDVLKQQGRVDVDADWNEQQAINVHRVELESVDVIGRTGAPLHAPGFAITADGPTLRIGSGRYYVDGLLCENEADGLDYRAQPDRPGTRAVLEELREAGGTTGIVYLDVWLRHLTALNDPLLREIALGGPDTATRTQIVWQVRVLPLAPPREDRERLAALQARQAELQARLPALIAAGADISGLVQELADLNREITTLLGALSGGPISCDTTVPAWDRLMAPAAGRLAARSVPTPPVTDLCQLPPRAGYQRTENQLYRVEVHQGGDLGHATFKWSRDNGSVVTAVEAASGLDLTVRSTGPDEVLGFAANQWIELVDDASDLAGVPGRLLQADHVPAGGHTITMKNTPPAVDPQLHPLARRWDQSGPDAGADGVLITGDWQPLEDGVEVQFTKGPFRTGDYWLIPARTATGDVEWPRDGSGGAPAVLPPRGIEHHLSRLALIEVDRETLKVTADCRKIFPPLTELTAPPAPTVKRAMHVKGTSWRNDAPLPLAEFLEKGLVVDFDQLPDPLSLSFKTMIVTLEVPMTPDTGFEPAGGRDATPRLGVILVGEIKVENNQVRWVPARSTFQTLASFLRGMPQLLGRVTLKGAVIWSVRERLHLDGRALGEPVRIENSESLRTELGFPSGVEASANDFESWFLLALPTVNVFGRFLIEPDRVRLRPIPGSFMFISEATGGPVEVVATITLNAATTSELVITLSAPENNEILKLPSTVTVPAGGTATRFPITPGARVPDGNVRIVVTASAGGAQIAAALTLNRG